MVIIDIITTFYLERMAYYYINMPYYLVIMVFNLVRTTYDITFYIRRNILL